MADSKSGGGGGMDYWREYFGSSNADIFETIKRAIVVAASDHPKEFRIRRDSIAQTLFSCKLLKCSGCNQLELALPGDDQEHDDETDDDGDGGDDRGVKCDKGESLDVHATEESKIDDDRKGAGVNSHQISKYSYGEAEALTDEIEEETQMFGEVMRIKELIDNHQNESESALYNSLRKLQLMALSVETLKATEIGKSVNALRRHATKNVSQTARTLIEAWKVMVDEWVAATEKTAALVAEATPESLNPSVLDEEEGLPSPPLDDLAFFYPHTSLELSEFFDGMDDCENPASNGELNKSRDGHRTAPKEKQSVPKSKQQKPLNEPPVVLKESSESDVKKSEGSMKLKKQPNVVKPITPPVADSGPGRQVKSNTEKPTVPKRPPMAHQQTKPKASVEPSVKDKFEAAKRKLQERYQQVEKAKKQRTIQVMELHDLPKQSFPPRSQHTRPGNNHNRNSGSSRRLF